MRGRGAPAAASFLRRRGEEGSGAGEESWARRPRGGSRAGGQPRPAGRRSRRVPRAVTPGREGARVPGRPAGATAGGEGPLGCHGRGRRGGSPCLGAAVSPVRQAATTAPPRAAERSGPGWLLGRAPPSFDEGGAEGSPPEPPGRESRRSMAGAESRRPLAPGRCSAPLPPRCGLARPGGRRGPGLGPDPASRLVSLRAGGRELGGVSGASMPLLQLLLLHQTSLSGVGMLPRRSAEPGWGLQLAGREIFMESKAAAGLPRGGLAF